MSRLYNVFLSQIEIYGWTDESVKIFIELFLREANSEDIENLTNLFLESPDNSYRAMLLDVIMTSENDKIAEKIYSNCIEDGKLKHGVSPEVFKCLGYMNYYPIKNILMSYIQSKDYSENKNSCLGLLNFDCSEYEEIIIEEIDKCFKSSIFNEFIPVLASKIKNKDYKEIIYEHGNTIASVDCNAGLIIAVALLGDKELFKKILWNEKWEVFDCGTGTGYWSFIGMQILNLSFKELFEDIKKLVSEKEVSPKLKYYLGVLYTLLKNKIEFTVMPFKIKHLNEKYEDIYKYFFEPDEGISLSEILEKKISDIEFINSFAELRRLIRRRAL
jgi:hypothetical protein